MRQEQYNLTKLPELSLVPFVKIKCLVMDEMNNLKQSQKVTSLNTHKVILCIH